MADNDQDSRKTPLWYYERAIEEIRLAKEELHASQNNFLVTIQSLQEEVAELKSQLQTTQEELASKLDSYIVEDMIYKLNSAIAVSRNSISEIGIVVLTPVIFASNCGNKEEEYVAPEEEAAQYTLDQLDSILPPHARIISVWYEPHDNIAHLTIFSLIHVYKDEQNERQVKLRIQAYPGANGRIRLAIRVLFVLDSV